VLGRNAAGSQPEALMVLTPLLLLSDGAVQAAREKRRWRGEALTLSTRPRYGYRVPARRWEWRQAHTPLSKALLSELPQV
jgi:hypothetical protein